MNLRLRIFLTTFLSTIVIIGIMVILTQLMLTQILRQSIVEFNQNNLSWASRMYAHIQEHNLEDQMDELYYIMYEYQNENDDVNIYIVDSSGEVILHENKSLIGQNISYQSYIRDIITNEASEGRVVYNEQFDPYKGEERLGYFLQYDGLFFIGGPFRSELNIIIYSSLYIAFIVLAAAVAANVILSGVVANMFYKPIKQKEYELRELVHKIDSRDIKKKLAQDITRITGYNERLDKKLKKNK
jgi:hypothetical protein